MRNEDMYHAISWAEFEERYGESRADFIEDGHELQSYSEYYADAIGEDMR